VNDKDKDKDALKKIQDRTGKKGKK